MKKKWIFSGLLALLLMLALLPCAYADEYISLGSYTAGSELEYPIASGLSAGERTVENLPDGLRVEARESETGVALYLAGRPTTAGSYTFTVTSGRDLVANFSAQQPSLVGDVNEDGVISIDDVSVLLSHVLGNISLTGQVLINADVNGDGVISIDDVSTLLYMSMNK